MDRILHFSKHEKLTGCDTYLNWSARIKTHLRLKDAWDEITSNPTPLDGLPPEQVHELQQRRYRGIAVLQASVSNEILLSITANDDDPALLWEQLRSCYASGNNQRKLTLTAQLANLRLSEGSFVEEHMQTVDILWGNF
jgi:hypothetical protein